MTKKPDPPAPDDPGFSHSEKMDDSYQVEELVFNRQNYDTTASFEMDIDKAKKITLTSGKLPSADGSQSQESLKHTQIHQTETDDIKKTLAELRQAEMHSEMDNESGAGLWDKFKKLFSH